MKKVVIGILSATFILGAGTFAFAQTNNDEKVPQTFEQMKPYMEKMHPQLSEKEQKDMFNSCHGSNDTKQNQNTKNTSSKSMMSNL